MPSLFLALFAHQHSLPWQYYNMVFGDEAPSLAFFPIPSRSRLGTLWEEKIALEDSRPAFLLLPFLFVPFRCLALCRNA